jgi:serine/threonine protein phosphatase PrpC
MMLRFAGKTDIGLVRDLNEDSLLILEGSSLVAVADGMGGHQSGDIASQLAVATVSDFFRLTVARKDATWPFPLDTKLNDEENNLRTALRVANRTVFERSRSRRSESGMGTTIVAALFNPQRTRVTIGHIGDSRCYQLRDRTLTLLTWDHSLVNEAAQNAPWLTKEELDQIPSNVITRALGIQDEVLVDLRTEPTQAGDIYLLCSDGLSGLLDDATMTSLLLEASSLDEAAEALVEAARSAGGHDNITVVLAQVVDQA